MPDRVFQWELHGQYRQQRNQTFVLFWCERIAIQTFEFNADGKVIAIGASCVRGFTRMPCTMVTTDKLQQLAPTANEEMR